MSGRVQRSLVGLVLVALALTLLPAALSAAPRALIRKVKPGETAAKLAKRYYGKAFAARILLLANGLNGLAAKPPALFISVPR